MFEEFEIMKNFLSTSSFGLSITLEVENSRKIKLKYEVIWNLGNF